MPRRAGAKPRYLFSLGLRRCGDGREPWAVCEELAQRVELADAPFGGGGEVGLDDCEVGEPFEGAPAAAGSALLDLDGADVALRLLVNPTVRSVANRRIMSWLSRNRRASRRPSLLVLLRLCWLSVMPLATAPRYQALISASCSPESRGRPEARAAVAAVLAWMSRSAMDRAQTCPPRPAARSCHP